MARIFIDGKVYEVRDGDNLLSAALGHGIDLPYFCWHPALGSVGACRQCAVKQYKDAGDTRGRLVMACMTRVADGALFSVADREASDFRASVIEWLMLNHPHDCPVCDEGGECHLQDMTLMTGHTVRRARLPKRTYVSQDLGPFLTHEMNRCITCYRCVRFYRDYAGGTDLHAFASKNHVYFGRVSDGPLESPFSGNLAEVCPTGVFTDKTLARHYTRKWDLQSAPSLCVHCGMGCNTFAAERYGTLRRITNRYHGELNGYFLCDRGRFGYEFVNGPERPRMASLRTAEGALETMAPEAALQHLAAMVQGRRLVGVGSPRASLESNYALWRLVGRDNFFSGLAGGAQRGAGQTLAALGTLRVPTLAQVEQCDAVLVLGEDPEATNPRLSLAVRQALRGLALARAGELEIPQWQDASVRDATPGLLNPLYILSPLPTALDGLARKAARLDPEECAGIARGAARLLQEGPRAGRGEDAPLAQEIAAALRGAKRPLVIAGGVAGSEALLAAARTLVTALGGDASLVITVAECNTLGVALFEGHPLEALPTGGEVALLVVENDLFRRLPAPLAEERLAQAGMVATIDCIDTPTTARSRLVLPAAAFAEAGGLYVNYEGRAQAAWQVYAPDSAASASWRWVNLLGARLGRMPPWESLPQLRAAMAEDFPLLAASVAAQARLPQSWRIARQSHRASGRTAALAHRTLHEPPPPRDRDSPYSFSMEGFGGPIPAGLAPRYWVPRWNSQQAVNFYQREIGGALRGGDGGVRLFQPRPAPPPPIPERAAAEWVALPLHRLFGEEELSARAPAVAARTEPPCAALDPQEAARLGVGEGEQVIVALGGEEWRLPVRLLAMARGVVALSAVGPWSAHGLPAAAQVRRAPP